MNRSFTPVAVTVTALSYLIVLAYLMSVASYNIWGAFVVVPPFAWMTVSLIRRLFWGSLTPLATPLIIGYGLKILGSVARYWVAFDAYDGVTDSEQYHNYGRAVAGAFWAGRAPITDVLPGDSGTQFVQRITAFIYAIVGSSMLAGFMVFATLAWWGMAFFVKAACTALPGMARLKYTWLCVLCPSIIYWPSSIGKEALMMLFLGIGTFGLARLIAGRGAVTAILFAVPGIGLAGVVRPHLAGIWLSGLIPALVVVLGRLLRPQSSSARRGPQLAVFGVISVLAIAAFVSAASAALDIFQANDDQGSLATSVNSVLRETTRRSLRGGSSFSPPQVESPIDWPYAVVRTLTRPTLLEASGVFQIISAMEIFALFTIAVFSWRRVVAVPYWLIRQPFVTLVCTVLFTGGLAYTSFGNLGILARQKSLLFPFMLLLTCIPEKPKLQFVGYRPTSMLDEYGIRERVAAGATRRLPQGPA